MARFLSARDLKPDVASGQLSKRQVRNDSGVDIAEGEVVVVTGVYQSLYLAVEKADADSTTTLEGTLFIADMPIKNGTFGTAVAWKLLTGVNTSGASLNDPVYVSSTAGGWSLSGGGTSRRIGSVVTVDASDGVVLLAPGDEVPSEGHVKAVIEADASLDLDAGATIGGVQIASTDDVRTDAEIVAAVEASATLDLDAGATIGGSGIVSDADLALVALDDLADVSVASPSDQDVLTWDDGTSTWVAQASGGGLTGLTNVSTADYAGFTVDGTNDDLVLAPNGNGAVRLDAGGQNRGSYAVCLVPDTLTTAYARGLRSIAIGYGAYANQSNTTAIGYAADANGGQATGLGFNARGIGLNATAVGQATYAFGDNTTAIGSDAQATVEDAVALGYDAEATQADAVAIGALSRASRTSSIVLNATGAASAPLTRDSTRINKLFHVVELRAAPTDGTPTEATSDGAAASTGNDASRNVVVLADGKVVGFTLCMTAIQATTNDAAMYEIVGAAKCLSGTASIIGANTTTAKEDDAGWDCTVTTTSNRLVVTCTADAGGASTWRGTLTLTYED